MKLATLRTDSGDVLAAVDGDDVVDLSVAAPDLPGSMPELLAQGQAGLDAVAGAIGSGQGRSPLAGARLGAPVPNPQKFCAIGLNYADHIAETNSKTPEYPTVFVKLPSCITGPKDDVWRPRVSERLDYEGELAFVIGQECKHVSAADAPGVIAGYTIVNDVSVRDYQRRTSQFTLGKSFDTHGVMGPWIVTADEVGDPHDLEIKTMVNGEVRQHSNTKHLIFDCFELVAALSEVCSLMPGDVIATGTSSGVAAAMDPPAWMVPGDVCRIEIENIGAIENTIVEEPR
ncbi:MAG: fumarylacetoacetate hydrolase family protein [Actinomycetia bacterium]|nr:fumarylacetoacetate hydrolase family protein [Actinomycetes bacterium]MCP4083545.1 fumarylacetoacetate hydrolase family protein [Actinomycetes bacterium]